MRSRWDSELAGHQQAVAHGQQQRDEALVLLHGPSQRDAETVAIRELGKAVLENESLVPVLLPVGDGMLVAKKVWLPEA